MPVRSSAGPPANPRVVFTVRPRIHAIVFPSILGSVKELISKWKMELANRSQAAAVSRHHVIASADTELILAITSGGGEAVLKDWEC